MKNKNHSLGFNG